jgi:hypothetical protein
MVTYKGCQKRGGQRRFGNGPHKEEREEDDHEGPGPITSRRPWQPGTLMSKISRTVRGGEEVARNVRKGCRTLDEDKEISLNQKTTRERHRIPSAFLKVLFVIPHIP